MDEELLQRIRTDPTVMVGKPAIRVSRVPVELILKLNDSTDPRGPIAGYGRTLPKGRTKGRKVCSPEETRRGVA